MTIAFAPMSKTDRSAFQAHYMTYMRRRDGMPCLATRTLSRREESYRTLRDEPVRRTGRPALDQAVFDRNVARRRPEPGLDEATLWALATAKANRAEHFGVEHKLRMRGFEPGAEDDLITYVEIQELYHTRILIDALAAVGIETKIGEPVGITRFWVKLFGELPRFLVDVIALATEVIGVTAFRLLLERARDLFAHQPAALSRIETLFGQLLVDEVGHVHFLRSRLGAVRLALARTLVPLALRAMLDDIPELGMLLGPARLRAEVRRAAIDETVTCYPDRPPVAGSWEVA